MEKNAIQQKAYELWEAEGRPHGRDIDHWERAETAVTASGMDSVGASDDMTTKLSKTKPEGRVAKKTKTSAENGAPAKEALTKPKSTGQTRSKKLITTSAGPK